MSKNRQKPVQHITEWSGLLNNYPIKAILRLKEDQEVTKGQWLWWTEVYWDESYASDNNLTNEKFLEMEGDFYSDEMEAFKFGSLHMRALGFQLKGEIQ